MEIKIGLQDVARELNVETDETAETLKTKIADAITSGAPLRLTDTKGREVFVAGTKIAYVELGAEHQRPVGFGAL